MVYESSIRSIIVASILGSVVASLAAQSTAPPTPPAFSSQVERHLWITSVLMPYLEQFRGRYHNVPRSDGEALRWMVTALRAKRTLEIGTANGYSALWLSLGLEATGGKLTTVEIDPEKVREARANLERAGVQKVVSVIEGDALKVVPELREKFDFIFIDIGPRSLPFFKVAEAKLRKNGVIAIHKPPTPTSLQDVLDELKNRPEWVVTTIQTGAPTGILLLTRKG